MRFRLTRESYLSRVLKQPHQVIRSKHSPAIVYLFDNNSSRPCAMGFYGKADKPSLHYSFSSLEHRARSVANWLKSMDETAARKAQRKAEKKAFVHSLKVGDVLRTSWGYDQTNIEYFEVTGLIGKTMVEVREIAQEREETHFMQGDCVPVPGKYIGSPMRKRVLEGNSLDIHGGFGYARLQTPTVVAGTKVYGASHWTAYA